MSQSRQSGAPNTPVPVPLGKRLFTITGLLPLGVFMLLHVIAYSPLLWNAESLQNATTHWYQSPLGVATEVVCLWLPLLYHSLYGLNLIARGSLAESSASNPVLQRLTGFFALAFIAHHVAEFRGTVLLGRLAAADLPNRLYARLSSTSWLDVPWYAVLYLTALGACAYHLTSGVAAIAMRCEFMHYGGRRRVKNAALAFGVLLFLLGAHSIIYFATGKYGTGKQSMTHRMAEPVQHAAFKPAAEAEHG